MSIFGHWGFQVAPGWRFEVDSGNIAVDTGDRRHDDVFCEASWKVLDHDLGLSLHDPKHAAVLRSVAVIFNNACKDRAMQQRLLIVEGSDWNAWHLKHEHAAGS